MARRLRILWTFLLTLASLAAWTEARWVGHGALIHAQWHFVWAWGLSLLWWCRHGDNWGRGWAAVGLTAHFALYSQPYWAPPARVDDPGESLRALWFNAWGRPTATAAIHKLALELDVDFIALCQAGGVPALRRLAEDYPYQAYDHDDRIGLFSRIPIRGEDWIDGEPGHQPRDRVWLRAELDNNLEVWVGHVQQPHETAHPIGMAKLYQAGQRPGPGVLLADLNTTPWAADFKRGLAAGWTSARAGYWPTRTWRDPAQPWLRWPIDHVLVRGQVGVQDFRVLPSIGSDHFPILVELVLPELE